MQFISEPLAVVASAIQLLTYTILVFSLYKQRILYGRRPELQSSPPRRVNWRVAQLIISGLGCVYNRIGIVFLGIRSIDRPSPNYDLVHTE